jgi:Family of unknown function (DUF6644)
MTGEAPAIFVALEQSGFGAAIRQSAWLFPVANVGHILALAVFAGALAVMDIRLLGGLAATSPAHVLMRARSIAIAAFVMLAATGFLLFTAEASHLILNPVFQIKLTLIGLGLVNLAIFEFGVKRSVTVLGPGATMPASAKTAGFVSLAIWLAVAACGRTIAYF